VAETVFASAVVDRNVPLVTPLALVFPGWTNVLFEPVEDSTTAAPGIGLSNPSRTVTVIVEVLEPLLAVIVPGAALTDDCAAEGLAGFTVTPAVCVIETMGPAPTWAVADTVFDSASVELRVPVVTPLALVVPEGWMSVLPVVGVADSTTDAP
jgi:hypothetical protein